jgi:hypothetical protein
MKNGRGNKGVQHILKKISIVVFIAPVQYSILFFILA